MLTRLIIAVLVVAFGTVGYLALPPRAQTSAATGQQAADGVRGVIHVHTNRSDGTGSVEQIAGAARRAGLGFVIVTDHGDGTRKPDAPRYFDGVLCIDAVEISTNDGHLLALGLPQAPYPLAGEARDVVADVARLGGFAIVAHPDSDKSELRWSAWDVPVDGLEWLNADSQWRDESRWSLSRALFTYPFRGLETLASLLDRPDAVLKQWDALTHSRRIVSIAGTDAHARLGLRSLGEPYDNSPAFHIPSYDRMLRLFSNVLPQTSLSGDAAADAAAVLAAIRNGHVYSIVDAVGGTAALAFTATDGKTRVSGGDALQPSGAVTLRTEIAGRADARIDLIRNGTIAATVTGEPLEHVVDAASSGAYRVEVSLPAAPGNPPVPWIVSNPIYLGALTTRGDGSAERRPASVFSPRYSDGPATGWAIETSPASLGAIDVTPAAKGRELAFRYAVGGAASSSPFAALRMDAGADLEQFDRLVFTARADRPTRISVQLREPGGEAGERWHRSVFLDTDPREVIVYFDDLRPRGPTTTPRPTLARVASVLFVVDTVNTALGANGRIWFDDVKYAR